MNSDNWFSLDIVVSQLSETVSGNMSVSPSLETEVPCLMSRLSTLMLPGMTSSDLCTVILVLLAPISPILRWRPVSDSWDVEFDFWPMPLAFLLWMLEMPGPPRAVSLRLPSFLSESALLTVVVCLRMLFGCVVDPDVAAVTVVVVWAAPAVAWLWLVAVFPLNWTVLPPRKLPWVSYRESMLIQIENEWCFFYSLIFFSQL